MVTGILKIRQYFSYKCIAVLSGCIICLILLNGAFFWLESGRNSLGIYHLAVGGAMNNKNYGKNNV